jgi:hypothetical protein
MSVARPTVATVHAPVDQTTTAPATVLDRLVAAGISEARATHWVTSGGVRVNGEPVNDPGTPAAVPARITLHS